MEYVIWCVCSMLCFVCGAWAARGMVVPRRRKRMEDAEDTCASDALSRDIAAMLAYSIPGKEEQYDEE